MQIEHLLSSLVFKVAVHHHRTLFMSNQMQFRRTLHRHSHGLKHSVAVMASMAVRLTYIAEVELLRNAGICRQSGPGRVQVPGCVAAAAVAATCLGGLLGQPWADVQPSSLKPAFGQEDAGACCDKGCVCSGGQLSGQLHLDDLVYLLCNSCVSMRVNCEDVKWSLRQHPHTLQCIHVSITGCTVNGAVIPKTCLHVQTQQCTILFEWSAKQATYPELLTSILHHPCGQHIIVLLCMKGMQHCKHC